MSWNWPEIGIALGMLGIVAGVAWIYPPAGLIMLGLLALISGVVLVMANHKKERLRERNLRR